MKQQSHPLVPRKHARVSRQNYRLQGAQTGSAPVHKSFTLNGISRTHSQVKFPYLQRRRLTRTAAAALLSFLMLQPALSHAARPSYPSWGCASAAPASFSAQSEADHPESATTPSLHIVIADSEVSVNNIERRTARQTVIEVDDESDRPVPGAVVTLRRRHKNTGAFAHSTDVVTLITGHDGRVRANAFEPNESGSQSTVEVTATFQGRAATRAIPGADSEMKTAVTSSSHVLSRRRQSAEPGSLHIAIAEGQGAINNVKQRTVREIMVQVQDENHKPVPSAVVTLVAPAQGPGGTFAGNQKFLSLVTDNGGRITTSAFRPNGMPGAFKLQVTASSQGSVATGAITQENSIASPALGPTSHHSRLTRKKVILVAGTVAAGVAISLAVGHHHGGYTPPGAY